MIDAYTIGITLALDNGVASGIAAIRQDLAALDRAVASSTAGLLIMRRLSESLKAVTPASPAPVPPALPQRPSEVTELALSTPPAAVATAPPWTTPSSRLPQPASVGLPALLPPSRGTNQEAAAAPSRVLAPANPTPPAAALFAPFTFQIEPERTRLVDPQSRQMNPVSPSLSQLQSPVPAVFSRTSAVPAIAPVPPSPPAPLPEPTLRPTRHSMAPGQNAIQARVLPVAPTAVASQSMASVRTAPSALPANSPNLSQMPSNAMAGSPHGEIILDSVRLGRWMSDRLARAVGRPGSGTTAFDPRISATYPGAPNGS